MADLEKVRAAVSAAREAMGRAPASGYSRIEYALATAVIRLCDAFEALPGVGAADIDPLGHEVPRAPAAPSQDTIDANRREGAEHAWRRVQNILRDFTFVKPKELSLRDVPNLQSAVQRLLHVAREVVGSYPPPRAGEDRDESQVRRLEDVLAARRDGKAIRRKRWVSSHVIPPGDTDTSGRPFTFKFHGQDLDADDWEVCDG